MDKLNGCIFSLKMMTLKNGCIFWNKVSADIKKIEFCIYNKEFLKSKIKSHDNEVIGFNDKKVQKVDFNFACLTVITLDYALKENGNHYRKCS